ncbi:hypothetical protein B0T10DRAFT_487485 [Thelonectria olida]|uniref:Uncharacterized protein n=1 Tax=Thelonectria olida TaxID=1576542 RepID=A0A9P8W448_9HYPO|nr:hypothetical protein B0T10DRAFT_487485 [Thelonectria olida]
MASSSEVQPGEYPSLSLSGDSFFFSGPKYSCGNRFHSPDGVPSHVNNLGLNLRDNNSTVYVVLGPRNQYFRCVIPQAGEVASMNDTDLSDYEDLTVFLDHQNVARPRFLSLGAGGHFYIRAETGVEKWDVPSHVSERLLRKYTGGDASIEGLWLGCRDAFVAQRWDGTKLHDLRGQYPGLQRALQRRGGSQEDDESADVASVAMDLEGGRGFVILWRDGRAECEEGMMRMESGRAFERWCAGNGYKLRRHK